MGVSQEEIYSGLDLDLSWSESDLPERERTRHVHRLHPYLGKYIPQLVEELFRRHVPPRRTGARPVRRLGDDARPGARERSRFGRDRRGRLQLPADARQDDRAQPLRPRARPTRRTGPLRGAARAPPARRRPTCDEWFAPQARDELLRFRSLAADYEHADVLRIVLARAARSARRTTHFDLDFPKAAQLEPYWCFKHKRECRPVERAEHFIRRYTLDTLTRLKEFARVRGAAHRRGAARRCARAGPARLVQRGRHLSAVSRTDRLPRATPLRLRAALTRRPARARDRAAESGTSRAALGGYTEGISAVLASSAAALEPRGRVVVVVNDRRQLYPEILERAGLSLEQRYQRHVNRRTGRRAGEYFEDVLVARRV